MARVLIKLLFLAFFVAVLSFCLLVSLSHSDSGNLSSNRRNPRIYLLGTGSVAKNYYPLGRALALVATRLAKGDFIIKAVSTNASIDNLKKIGQKELDLGMTLECNAYMARLGKGPFEESVQWEPVICLYPSYVLLVADRKVKDLEDVRERRVWMTPAGGGQRALDKLILQTMGIGFDEIQLVSVSTTQVNCLMEMGLVDVAFHNLPYPSAFLTQLLSSGRFHLLSLPPRVIEAVCHIYPPMTEATISSNGKRIRTLRTRNLLVAGPHVPRKVKDILRSVVKHHRKELLKALSTHSRASSLFTLVSQFAPCE